MVESAAQPLAKPGQPVLRWNTRTHSIAGIELELARIWSSVSLTVPSEDGEPERRVAPRSSVMNLVVIAGRAEMGERVAAIVDGLTGRHPSRTIVVSQADPDGPAWIDAQVQAHCMLPREGAPETCAELVYLTVGGGAGQHLVGCVSPLLIHDLPVTIWWAGEPRLETRQAADLLNIADRVLVDGSSWSGDGLSRLLAMSRLPRRFQVEISDFAMLRQARWREAIASTFDRPALVPFLRGLREVTVTYAVRDGTPGLANVIKPLYHVAWLASRLKMTVAEPLVAGSGDWSGYTAMLRNGRRHVGVTLKPVQSDSPRGTTLSVHLTAERGRGEKLAVDVTASAAGVVVNANVDGLDFAERRFLSHRMNEAELLAETIEGVASDRISAAALAMSAALVEGRG